MGLGPFAVTQTLGLHPGAGRRYISSRSEVKFFSAATCEPSIKQIRKCVAFHKFLYKLHYATHVLQLISPQMNKCSTTLIVGLGSGNFCPIVIIRFSKVFKLFK